MIANNILDLIGNTPIIRLSNIEEKFNLKYSEKYGPIYTKNSTEEDHVIHDEIKWISDMLNNYYKNKSVAIITPEEIKIERW